MPKKPSLTSPKFTADQFKPTKFDTAADKAKFGNQLLAFIEADFPESKFTKAFYNRLMYTFGHIAHYDRNGFWSEFFTCTADKVSFLHQTMTYGCYGQPEHTFCDVEQAVIARLCEHNVLSQYRHLLAQETEAAERAQLARLQAKYSAA